MVLVSKLAREKSDLENEIFVISLFFEVIVAPSKRTSTGVIQFFVYALFLRMLFEIHYFPILLNINYLDHHFYLFYHCKL